jgi:hypothetical protein
LAKTDKFAFSALDIQSQLIEGVNLQGFTQVGFVLLIIAFKFIGLRKSDVSKS